MNEYRKLADALHLRFKSGNGVPVERAHITAAEWALIQPALCREGLLADIAEGVIHTCDHSSHCDACDSEVA